MVSLLLIQLQMNEVVECRRRRLLYVVAAVACLASTSLGWVAGNSNRLQMMNDAVMLDTGGRPVKAAWVYKQRAIVKYEDPKAPPVPGEHPSSKQ